MTSPAPSPATDPASSGDSVARDRDRGSRRVVLAAFGVSLVLHLAAILLYPLLFGEAGPLRPAADVAQGEVRPEGMQVVRIAEIPEENPEEPDAPRTERIPEPVAPTPRTGEPSPGPEVEAVPEPAPAAGRSAAERLRRTVADARLLLLPEEVVDLSPEQVAELRLRWAIEEMGDSLAAAEALLAEGLDWTVEGEDGKRWGVSPEGIHLGDLTLPLPAFGAPYDPDGWKGSKDRDLARAAATAAAWETIKERLEAMRERRERERARTRPDTTRAGSGSGGDAGA